MKKKYIFPVLAVLLFLFAACTANTDVPLEDEGPAPPLAAVDTVSFAAVGDNLIHGVIFMQAAQRAGQNGYDFTPLYENVSSFLSSYELRYINQETLVNREIAPAHYPCFSSPPEVGDELLTLGFRLFSLSNNHTYDQGALGIAATLRYWAEKDGVATTAGLWKDGLFEDIPLMEINGITFALLAYTEHTNGLPTPYAAEKRIIYTYEEAIIEQQIRLAATLADVVIVCPHWGVEDSHTVSSEQRILAQKMVDWGAGLVLGSHPHVLQEIEILENNETGRKVPVIYSLGNFVSAQSLPKQLVGGIFTMNFVKTGGITTAEDLQFYPTVTHYGSGYSNVTVYLLEDYTKELANAHGVRSAYPGFGLEFILQTVQANIAGEYLTAFLKQP